MINSSGGSSHDPQAQLGPQMWDRPMAMLARQCGNCNQSSDRTNRGRQLRSVRVGAGPAPGDYAVCVRCDCGPHPHN